MNTSNNALAAGKTFLINAPNGTKINIPVSYDPATDEFSNLKEKDEIVNYYEKNGFVIIRNLLPGDLCDSAREAFLKEVKPYKGYIYRQASANPEKHVLTAHNYMLNAVMNIQDLDNKKFPQFRQKGLEILVHRNIRSILKMFIEREPVLIQSMYFEGNPATWPHQDKDYLDAMKPDTMMAAWIALEDIKPGAGRFYIYPTSQNIDIDKIGNNLNIILDREAYKKLVIDTINEYKLECKAPALNKGDVLLWHGKTIHGSLETTQPEFSRSSMTAHYIPVSKTHLQLQVREKKLKLREVDGMGVNFPKDQNLLSNKLIFLLETSFPSIFKSLKKSAIRYFSK